MRFRAPAIFAAVLVVLLVLVAGVVLDRGRPSPREIAPAASVPEVTVAPEPAPTSSPSRSALEPAPTEGQAAVSRPAQPESPSALTELRGRFLLPSGGPAVGTQLRLSGWQANQERVLRYGLPKGWRDLEAVADSEGRFTLRFDPPLAFQFTLDAKLPGHAEVKWRWDDLPPEDVVDVGTIVLPRTGTISGRVVDREGRPAPGDWYVYAATTYEAPGDGGDVTTVRAPADAVTGAFRLEDLPPGPARLTAHSRIANWIEGPAVTVEEGKQGRADIVYEGPNNSRRIAVIPFTRPFYEFEFEDFTITLHGSTRGPLVATKIPGSSQSWSFDDLDPGTYTAEIRNPRFKPWNRSGISPGQSLDAALEGNAGVSLTVVGDSDAPVEDYRLRIRFRSEGTSYELRGRGQAKPADGVYAGLVPGDSTLLVEVTGYSDTEAAIDDLQPGEVRPIRVCLSRGSTIGGRVLRHDGAMGVGGARVSLSKSDDRRSDIDGIVITPPRADGGREVVSEASGHFEFTAVPNGRYRLVGAMNSLLRVEREVEIQAPSASTTPDLVLPAFGYVSGRLIGLPGAPFEGWKVSARPDEKHPEGSFEWIDRELPLADVEPDGSFRVGPNPTGRVVVSALLFRDLVSREMAAEFRRLMAAAGPRIELGRVEVREGTDAEAEFDLRNRFPGELLVTATVDGRPVPGLVVEALGEVAAPVGRTGSDGTARLGPLFAGEWAVTVRALEGWAAPSVPARVPAGGEAQLRIDVVLVEGTLLVLDIESGKPLADRLVVLSPRRSNLDGSARTSEVFVAEGDLGGRARRRTDSEGKVRARLPAGTYDVDDASETMPMFPGEGRTWISWPPPPGAVFPVRIRRSETIEPRGR